MQRECKFCDNNQMINMEEAPPGSKNKWVVTNLDGSYHKHFKQGGQQTTTITPTQQPKQETVTVSESIAKTDWKERGEAIATAHQENMEQGELLRTSINNLTEKLDEVGTQLYNITKQLSSFNDIVRAYLDSVSKQ